MNEHPLRAYRRKHDVSLDQLAVQVGETTKASLSRIELGKQKPSIDLIDRIVAATKGRVGAADFLPSRRGQ